MKRKKVSFIFCVTVIAVFSFALLISCTTGSSPAPPGGIPAIVTMIDTGMDGATMLYKGSGSSGQTLIYIGHNTYGFGNGGLKYYDTGDWVLKDTGVDVDVGDFVFYNSDEIYIMGPYNTYYVDATGDPSGWSHTEILDAAGGTFGGSDIVLYDYKIYIVDPGALGAPYSNKLYIIDISANDFVTTVDLGYTNEGLTKIGVNAAQDEIYYTDTEDGSIFKSGLNPTGSSDLTLVTTTAAAVGPVYFNNNLAYVLCGAPWAGGGSPGVHMFDPAGTLPVTAAHFLDSGDLSAQYMVFEDNTTAYVTHYSGGVYQFDPSDEDSEFTIISGTDPAGDTGLQDIVLDSDSNTLYTAVNNSSKASKLMKIEFY